METYRDRTIIANVSSLSMLKLMWSFMMKASGQTIYQQNRNVYDFYHYYSHRFRRLALDYQ